MRISLSGMLSAYGTWSLEADGIFGEGIHLVTGDIGSGKSTLALMLAGLLPSEGRISREEITSSMVAFQFPEYHVTGSDLSGECRSWHLNSEEILASAGFGGKGAADPLTLSRGELKRLILACVLAKEYDLLILDEPFSSLDCAEKERLCSLLTGRKRGIIILFTHEQTFFPRVDGIWEIQGGRLLFRGRPPAALTRWDHAPVLIKTMVGQGRIPSNISREDLLEAACRM